MTTKQLAKHYATLTPDERLPLLMAANIRADEAECHRLQTSAPRESFTVPHTWGLSCAVQQVTHHHHMRTLELISAYRQAFMAYIDTEPDEPIGNRLEGVTQMYVYIFNSEQEGWQAFCTAHHFPNTPHLFMGLPGWDHVEHFKAHHPDGFTHAEAIAYAKKTWQNPDPEKTLVTAATYRDTLETVFRFYLDMHGGSAKEA